MSWVEIDISKFTYCDKDILERLYKETELSYGGLEDYLKIEPTEEYKNNPQRIERQNKIAKLSPDELEEFLNLERIEARLKFEQQANEKEITNDNIEVIKNE
jgi:hypothetical protein